MARNSISGPKGVPIAGNIFEFRKDPLAFLQEVAREYGDFGYFRFGPTRNAYLVTNPEHIREILVTKPLHFRKAKGMQVAKQLVGDGLITNEGKPHLRQRRMMQPAFHKQRIGMFADEMVELTEQVMGTWQDGEERPFDEEMMALTLLIICKTMFGNDFKEDLTKVGQAVDISLHYIVKKFSSFIDLPRSIPTKTNVQFQRASGTLDEIVYGIIKERRENPNHQGHDLLAMLLAARDEDDGTGMSDKQVRDEVMTVFLAGHETTANGLLWTLYLLSQHPEVEQKFWNELDTVLGGRRPTMEDMEHLPYLSCIITESLRLFPPAWSFSREVADDEVQIGGHTFKRGDTLVMSPYVMHRHPKYFADPEQFIPERWAGGELMKQLPPYVYIPFGGGSRVCIGNNFASMELTMVLATIGQTFKLRLSEKQPPVGTEPLVTLRPKGGLLMRVEKR